MKIAILGTRGYPYVYSGYETFVSELAPRLVKRGHDVTVYCHRGLFKSFPETVNGVRLRYVYSVKFKTLSQFTSSFFATLDAVFRRYDAVLYVNTANGPFGILTRLFRKKTAINVDGVEWLRPKWKGLGARYFYLASRLSTKFFDVVIADSDAMAEIYKKEFNAPSTVIEYGANILHSTTPELLSSYNLEPDSYYLIVGRLIPDNNADLIVKGFCRSNTRKKLVIVGDVPYRDAYASAIKKTTDERLLFTGYIKNPDVLRELYCNSFAYFHGHEYGGTNPTLLKALANGCCILALDTVFSREVLSDGKYGAFFKKDPDEVAGIIAHAESNPAHYQKIRSMTRERIRERYTWEIIADKYEKVFNQMAARRIRT